MSVCNAFVRPPGQGSAVHRPLGLLPLCSPGIDFGGNSEHTLPTLRSGYRMLIRCRPQAGLQGVALEFKWKHKRRRCRVCAAATGIMVGVVEDEGKGPGESRPVVFTTQYAAQFGQAVKIVGSTKDLGSWTPSDAPAMVWSEGDRWTLRIDLPPGNYEFKLVVDGGPAPVWEDGDNRMLEVPAASGAAPVTIDCLWGVITPVTQTPEQASPSSAPPEEQQDVAPFEGAVAAEVEEGNPGQAAGVVAEEEKEEKEEAGAALQPSLQAFAEQEEAGEGAETPAESLGLPTSTTVAEPVAQSDPVTPPEAETEKVEPAEPAVVSSEKAAEAPVTPPVAVSFTEESKDTEGTAPALAGLLGVLGLFAAPLVAYSEWTLRFTGCGLPPGPGGLLGAAEGVSYLLVAGVFGWSVTTRFSKGRGLPAGPLGLLGLFEGFSYLLVIASIVVIALQIQERGYIPGALPDSNCYGPNAPTPPPLPSLESLQTQFKGFLKSVLP